MLLGHAASVMDEFPVSSCLLSFAPISGAASFPGTCQMARSARRLLTWPKMGESVRDCFGQGGRSDPRAPVHTSFEFLAPNWGPVSRLLNVEGGNYYEGRGS